MRTRGRRRRESNLHSRGAIAEPTGRSDRHRSFVVAISTALITLIGSVLPQLDDSVKIEWVSFVGLSVLFLASGVLVVSIGAEYAENYLSERASSTNDEVIRASVPTLVRFRSRRDDLSIDEEGNGTLTWTFDVEKNSDQVWNTLDFPIFTESVLDPNLEKLVAEGDLPVKIERVLVDGEDRKATASLRYEERRIVPDSQRVVDYGRLSVPVQLKEGRSRARLEITLTFPEVWSPATYRRVDFFSVDVPYVTDHLLVRVSHTKADLAIAPPIDNADRMMNRPVVAISAIMASVDNRETDFESDNLVVENGSLVWETLAPKLGYRYRLNFRVIDRPATPSRLR